MAGKKGRSGGSKGRLKADGTRGKGAGGAVFAGFGGKREPRLDTGSLPSIQRHARWCLREVLAGRLDPSVSKVATDHHRTLLAARHQALAEGEMDELRELVRRAEAAAERRKLNEVADRYGSGADGVTRVVKRPRAAVPAATEEKAN